MCVDCSCNDWGHTPKNYPQHKVVVVVEKHHTGRIKLALLESVPYKNQAPVKISPEKIKNRSIWDGNESRGNFEAPELVLRAVMQAKWPTNEKGVDLYYSVVYRLTSYGCESFAIRDVLAFFKDNFNFFENILSEDTQIKLNGYSLHKITQLPAAFMIGTQSVSRLNTYQEKKQKT